MIVHRKLLALTFISLAAIALLGLRGDSPITERSKRANQSATGGLSEIQYIYPVSDLSAAVENAFF